MLVDAILGIDIPNDLQGGEYYDFAEKDLLYNSLKKQQSAKDGSELPTMKKKSLFHESKNKHASLAQSQMADQITTQIQIKK